MKVLKPLIGMFLSALRLAVYISQLVRHVVLQYAADKHEGSEGKPDSIITDKPACAVEQYEVAYR